MSEHEGDKTFRREQAVQSGRLDKKRFVLSADIEIRNRLADLREAVEDFMAKYPDDIAGVSLFGSHLKGYAGDNSDFDLSVFFKKTSERHWLERRQHRTEILLGLDRDVRQKTGQGSEILDYEIDEAKVVQNCTRDDEYGRKFLSRLFLPEIGKGLQKYRNLVIDTLEKLPDGEQRWAEIAKELTRFENVGFLDNKKFMEKRKQLYPQTLAEARKFFIQGVSLEAKT